MPVRKDDSRLMLWMPKEVPNDRGKLQTLLLACSSSSRHLLAATSAFGQSLEERYWLALNEGRDLSKLHEAVAKLAGPGRKIPPDPEDRAEALRLLDVIIEIRHRSRRFPAKRTAQSRTSERTGFRWEAMLLTPATRHSPVPASGNWLGNIRWVGHGKRPLSSIRVMCI